MKTYLRSKIEILPTDTLILDIAGLGVTETKGFHNNYISSKRFIEVTNVRQNPQARRILFVKIKNNEDLVALRESWNNAPITKDIIKHNEFAVYNYQLKLQ